MQGPESGGSIGQQEKSQDRVGHPLSSSPKRGGVHRQWDYSNCCRGHHPQHWGSTQQLEGGRSRPHIAEMQTEVFTGVFGDAIMHQQCAPVAQPFMFSVCWWFRATKSVNHPSVRYLCVVKTLDDNTTVFKVTRADRGPVACEVATGVDVVAAIMTWEGSIPGGGEFNAHVAM